MNSMTETNTIIDLECGLDARLSVNEVLYDDIRDCPCHSILVNLKSDTGNSMELCLEVDTEDLRRFAGEILAKVK